MKNKPKQTTEKQKTKIRAFKPQKTLKNQQLVLDSIVLVFEKNKIHPIIDLIETHLKSTNKSAFSKKLGISRATLYDMLSGNKNPTLRIFVNCVYQVLIDLGMKPYRNSSKTLKSSLPEKTIKSKKLILEAVVEVFKKNQIPPMIEIIRAYLQSKNKSLFAKNVGISRATLYDMLNGKKNPTLGVFMQCVHVMIK